MRFRLAPVGGLFAKLASGEEAGLLQFVGEIGVEDEVQAVLGEGLLLDADTELEHVVQGVLPFLVVADEGIVLEGVVGAFDVGFFERVGTPLIEIRMHLARS